MVVNKGRTNPGQKQQPPAYICQACTRVRRKQAAVDELVESVMIARLALPDALSALATTDPVEVERARNEVAKLEARLDLAADQYADGVLTGEQLRRITERIRPQVERAQEIVNSRMPLAWASDMTGPNSEMRWREASLDVRRSLIELLCEVTILPTGSGKMFDPSFVRIEWKS
ncbi:MAG: hypothetical protein ACR2M5_07425 [Nakamurella sp.]